MLRLIVDIKGHLRSFDARCPGLEKFLAEAEVLDPAAVKVNAVELVGKKQRKAKTIKKPKPATDIPCPCQDIAELYEHKLPELAGIQSFDGPLWEERKERIRDMWGWILTSEKRDGTRRATTADEAMEWLGEWFNRVNMIGWMMGREIRGGKHGNWKANFDYLIRGQKVWEEVIAQSNEVIRAQRSGGGR
jgi:hypothetical protein